MPNTPAHPDSATALPTATTSPRSTALAYALGGRTRASTCRSTWGSLPEAETVRQTSSQASVGVSSSRTSGPSALARAATAPLAAVRSDIGLQRRYPRSVRVASRSTGQAPGAI